MTTQHFTPSRLTLARMRRGLSKIELASLIGVTPRMVTAYEGGAGSPSAETLAAIAEALAFPEEFFSAPAIQPIDPRGATFRSLSSMTSGQRDAVLGAGTIAIDVARHLAARFTLPPASLPDYRGHDPEVAALELRAQWGFGARSISNVVHQLEAHGVRVFSLSQECADTVDGFSVWSDGIPFIFLNPRKSGERGRFDASHELGHLLLHQHGEPRGREAEHEADRFASAFLMPRETVVAMAPRLPSIESILALKKSWGVSTGALVRRLFDLQLISDWQYRSLCIEIARRGWRLAEPEGMPRETSQVLRKVFAAIRAKGPTARAQFAKELSISAGELLSLIHI